MEPTTLLLLLSLLVGAGATGYVASTRSERAYGVTRGATGAVRAGLASSRGRASASFSRPPAASEKGSSLGTDVGWFFRQLWGGVRTGAAFFGALRSGYRTAVGEAVARHQARRENRTDPDGRTPMKDRVLARLHRINKRVTQARGSMVGWLGEAGVFDQLPDRIQKRLGAWRRAGLDAQQNPSDDNESSLNGDNESGRWWVDPAGIMHDRNDPDDHFWTDDMGREHDARVSPPPNRSASAGQNGVNVTATADMTSLTLVTEFPNPAAMEDPLEDIQRLNSQIAAAMRHMIDGLHNFINAYAEADFSTAALTAAVGGLLESIQDDGLINPIVLADMLPPVDEAIVEALGLGEHGAQVEAEGKVESFKES